VRAALTLEESELAARLVDGVEPRNAALRAGALGLSPPARRSRRRPRRSGCPLCRGEAAVLYAEAAERWREFGNVPERTYALLGHGRCLSAIGDASAKKPLFVARELFASMGFAPAVTETARSSGRPRPPLGNDNCPRRRDEGVARLRVRALA
jgi:hypothetical protein